MEREMALLLQDRLAGYKRGLLAAHEELQRAQQAVALAARQVAAQEGAVQVLEELIEALELEEAVGGSLTIPPLPADTFVG